MIKMFTTQLTGLFQRISGKQEFEIEDSSRLLAQAAIGEGTIYIQAFGEMEGVAAEAISGAEPLPSAARYHDDAELTEADRVLIVTRLSTDEEAMTFARGLAEKGIPSVGISGIVSGDGSLEEICDFHVDTKVIKGLLPGEEIGERVSFPSSMAALYIYFALSFLIKEILSEYEE